MRAIKLTGGTVVELDPPRVERRDLVLDGAVIEGEAPVAEVVDCTGCLLLPGLVVGHTHAYSALAAGMPVPPEPTRTFKEILEKVWWRLDVALDEASLLASARVAALDAALSGVTCVVDHHESPSFIDGSLDVLRTAFEEVGIRSVLTYGATDRHGPEGAQAGLQECERFLEAVEGAALTRGAVGLHAPFTCSDDTLAQAADLAARTGAWLHYHAAEGPDDQAAARERWGERLFHHLEGLGLLTERTLLAHGVDMDPGEGEAVAASGAWVAHQARSNMNNGVGYAGRLAYLPKVALGTDGIDDDILAELKSAFFRRRESAGPTVWPDPVGALARGHQLAAAMFGAPLGQLSRGAPADVTVLAYDPPTPLTEGSLGAHLIFGASSRHVRDVFVAGRPVVRDGRPVGVDEARIRAEARAAAKALFARMD
ncbi:MAG: amidohydrolase family protein [Deltaproteobacteria bacterium]|nr:amidohydrolase family protein [Deltaproteobacteria bacterium]